MVLQCWKEDSVRLDGKYYQAPFPQETGIVGYPAHKIARAAGGEGEVDAEGVLRRFSVVPAPYQNPHPPIFVAVSRSEPSVRYCARNGFRVVHFSKGDGVAKYGHVYQEEAAKHGHSFQFGERQNTVRWPHIAKSAEDYNRKLVQYDLDIYKNFYSPFFSATACQRRLGAEHEGIRSVPRRDAGTGAHAVPAGIRQVPERIPDADLALRPTAQG
jgi:alkanesulfonate monooxygenase SsuD/methylene tetrahydromethanopterin reductase-like flavin-dependent oxidoreductase (luciferase family)